MHRPDPIDPRPLARLGGLLYLIVIGLGLAQQRLVRARLFVGGDAEATAERLRAAEATWRLGIAMEALMLFATVALAWVLYVLLRPVHRQLPLLAVFFCLVAVAAEAAYLLRAVEALFPLGEARYLDAFTAPQRAVMSHLGARGHVLGFGLALLLFSPYFLVLGVLIARSGFLPRGLGALYAVAGAAYGLHGFAQVLAPALADRLFPVIAVPAFVGELSLALWLLIRGVDASRWVDPDGSAR